MYDISLLLRETLVYIYRIFPVIIAHKSKNWSETCFSIFEYYSGVDTQMKHLENLDFILYPRIRNRVFDYFLSSTLHIGGYCFRVIFQKKIG